MTTTLRAPVAVLGAGITGLAAAWHLHRAGVPVVVFEASDRAGGALATRRQDGWLQEAGPNSLLDNSPEAAALIKGLGLEERRLFAAPQARHRFILRAGRLVAMPASPVAFATTGLFSFGAKLGLLGEPFRRRGDPALDETLASFVVRRLGREFLDYAINPFVAGVYSGDPGRLSVRHAFPKLLALEQTHGSLLRGALARRNASGGPTGRIFSFPQGLTELVEALVAALPRGTVQYESPASSIRRLDSGSWQVSLAPPHPVLPVDFSAVVCALPADALSALRIEADGPPLSPTPTDLSLLREIEQPPVASVFLGYRREDVAHPLNGFGFLVPAVEKRRLLGALFSSSLFAGRAPEGHVALTAFVGGMRQPELAGLPEDRLLALVREEFASLLGARSEPVLSWVRRWPRAIPQYQVGHGRFLDACAAAEAAAPGLQIGGNFRGGISVSQCIASGARLAAAVTSPSSSAA